MSYTFIEAKGYNKQIVSFVLIDTEDINIIENNYFHKNSDGYLTNYYPNPNHKGKGKHRFLHKMIIGEIPKNMVIDHINRNIYDNRKCNLRVVSYTVNALNSKNRSNNTSGKKGVSFNKEKKKWKASIIVYGKYISKYCNSFEEAYTVRDFMESVYMGDILDIKNK